MKRIFGLIMISLMMISISSCGKKENKFKPQYDVNLDYKINIAGHYSNFEALEDEFVRFNKYYPNAQLQYNYLDNYNKVISTALNSQEAPDIFFTFPWMVDNPNYSEIFDFTEDFSNDSHGVDLDVIKDQYIIENNDEISMLPIYVTTYGMMVNEKLFKKENIKIPTTYDQLISSCQKFKDKGYENVMMGHSSQIIYPLFFPHVCHNIEKNKEAINDLNEFKPEAGEYLRDSLNKVVDFMSYDFINLDNCASIKDDYVAVIKRFFEGDVPMMLAQGQTMSGTEKREKDSLYYSENPFNYNLRPVPSLDEGGIYLSAVNLCFSVNKNSDNLDIANEFMRFIISDKELDNMCNMKRMISPAKNSSLSKYYSPFNKAIKIYINELGITNDADTKIRTVGSKVAQGKMTIDEAIANWVNA